MLKLHFGGEWKIVLLQKRVTHEKKRFKCVSKVEHVQRPHRKCVNIVVLFQWLFHQLWTKEENIVWVNDAIFKLTHNESNGCVPSVVFCPKAQDSFVLQLTLPSEISSTL